MVQRRFFSCSTDALHSKATQRTGRVGDPADGVEWKLSHMDGRGPEWIYKLRGGTAVSEILRNPGRLPLRRVELCALDDSRETPIADPRFSPRSRVPRPQSLDICAAWGRCTGVRGQRRKDGDRGIFGARVCAPRRQPETARRAFRGDIC